MFIFGSLILFQNLLAQEILSSPRFLCFCIKLKIAPSKSVKNCVEILWGLYWICWLFAWMAIFTVLILLIHLKSWEIDLSISSSILLFLFSFCFYFVNCSPEVDDLLVSTCFGCGLFFLFFQEAWFSTWGL